MGFSFRFLHDLRARQDEEETKGSQECGEVSREGGMRSVVEEGSVDPTSTLTAVDRSPDNLACAYSYKILKMVS